MTPTSGGRTPSAPLLRAPAGPEPGPPEGPRRVRPGQAFNVDLLFADRDAAQFCSIIAESLTPSRVSGTSSTWVFPNHDVVRHASRSALRRARAATLLMLALPGSAYIYQGEELGLFEVADLPRGSLQDPIWERTGHRR